MAYALFSIIGFPLLEDKIKTDTVTTILTAIANGTQLGKEYVEWNGHGMDKPCKNGGDHTQKKEKERGKTIKTFTRSVPDELQSRQNTKLLVKLSCCSTGYLYTS